MMKRHRSAVSILSVACWSIAVGRAFTVAPLASSSRLILSLQSSEPATETSVRSLAEERRAEVDETPRLVRALERQQYELMQSLQRCHMRDTSESQSWTLTPSPQHHEPESLAVVTETPPSPSSHDQAIGNARWLLLGAAALYGTNFSLVKLLGQAHLPVGASSTLRFGMAALATSPWLLPQRKGSAAPQSLSLGLAEHEWQAAVLGFEVGIYNAIGYVAQAVGLETTAASKSAFLCSLAVVVVPLLDFVTGKRIQRQQLVGTVMAIVGVAILELGDLFATGNFVLTSGDLASLIQPLCFGLGFWKMEKCMHQHPDQANRSTAAQLLAVFVGSWMYSSLVEPGALNWTQARDWLSQPQVLFGLFWTGCITTALTVYMETLALKTLSAAETTLIFSTEPIWGTMFAALVMGEQLGIDSALGATLILAGCVFSNLGVNGIQQLLSYKGSAATGTGDSKVRELPHTESVSQVDGLNRNMSTKVSQARASVSAAFGGLSGMVSGMWKNVAIGTSVLAMDIEDFMDEILNKMDL